MKSALVEPFRKVLRPLIHWALKPHFGVHDEADHTVPVHLKKPSTFTAVMSAILAPVIFIILLPLIVVVVPVALIIGTIAVLVPYFTGDQETRDAIFATNHA